MTDKIPDTACVVVSAAIDWPNGDASRVNTHFYISRVALEKSIVGAPELIGYEAGKALTRELSLLLKGLKDDRPI